MSIFGHTPEAPNSACQGSPCTGDTDPSAKRKRIQPVVEAELRENYSEDSEGDDGGDDVQPGGTNPEAKDIRQVGTQANPPG